MLISTRGGAAVTASRAVLQGIAPDGGLYVPDAFPTFSPEDISALLPLSYAERAARILPALLTDFTQAEIDQAANAAYADGRFENDEPAKLVRLNGNTGLLELFHGPTLAFKDLALTILPHLLATAARKNGETDEICILVATSGDTGKAALEGFCDVPGTRCVVFYPKDGVSRAQYLQMATQVGDNTHVIAIEGNFDDAQAGVKRIFADSAFGEAQRVKRRRLTSANSINFGRLAPQVVYYFSAYADLLASGEIALGEPVHFVIPTGNFGNLVAADYARRMGLPVGKLMCASNANRVLSDFIRNGIYDINRPFYKTHSPSMDILVSSNLERYLFELCGRDSRKIREWMDSLRDEGRYAIGGDLCCALRKGVVGGWVNSDEGLDAIARTFRERHVLIDPHTAVATAMLNRYREATGDKTQAVIVATASPFKFGHAVARALGCAVKDDFGCCRALSRATGEPVPARIASLENMPVRHEHVCTPDSMQDMLESLFHTLS